MFVCLYKSYVTVNKIIYLFIEEKSQWFQYDVHSKSSKEEWNQ